MAAAVAVEAAEEDTVTATVVEVTVVAEAAGKRKLIDIEHGCIYGLCLNSHFGFVIFIATEAAVAAAAMEVDGEYKFCFPIFV